MFAETSAMPLFPTFVWMHQLSADDTGRMNNVIRAKLMSLLERNLPAEPGEKLQTEQNLHQLPEFQELTSCILAAASGVRDFMHVAEEGMEITSCWANFHPKGAFNPPHTHPNNYLGGVYYVDTPDNSGSITFEDPRAQPQIVSPRVSQFTAENTGRAIIDVKEGMLLLFPAWLVHTVDPNPSDQIRISISFNLMFPAFTEKVSPARWKGHVSTE
jgi:uncharacterized protein (TIGR02466 family)